MTNLRLGACCAAAAVLLLQPPRAGALEPRKAISQYTRTVWTQEHGLPQDTIRAIAQTSDGYLWLGTDEGLARFDGYEFTVFSKNGGALAADSVTALEAGHDGSLWIGTAAGLTRCHQGRFRTYTMRDGLADNAVLALKEDRAGTLWIAAGTALSSLRDGRFSNFSPGRGLPLQAVRAICEDRRGRVWIAGFGGVARRENETFVRVLGAAATEGNLVSTLLEDRAGNLWVAGSRGLLMLSPEGDVRSFDARNGLPDPFVRSLREDRDGNLWAGTNGGLSRLENGRFVSLTTRAGPDRDWVRAIFEDREGDLWVGMNGGLSRFRDDSFTVYRRVEGLPSDEPTAVYQDRKGRIWIGFHDYGISEFRHGSFTAYTPRDGLPSREIFSIREDRQGDLLIATREGFSRMRNGRFSNLVVDDPLGRRIVFDVLEDRQGRLWTAGSSGLNRIEGRRTRNVLPGGPLLNDAVVVLCETRDGALWSGTYGKGLWRLKDGEQRLYTTADGLASDQIRALYEDGDGTLWIGTFGGGLNALRGGRFFRYTTTEGLLSDNVAHIEEDGEGSLWLSTPRGICRLSKSQLLDFDLRRITALTPVNYGVEDGLPSSQCAPGYPAAGLGERTADGRLWFPTSRGLAVVDPGVKRPEPFAPSVQVVEIMTNGRPIDPSGPLELAPGGGRLQFRYAGIHLSAPAHLRYAYRLEPLDRGWVQAGTRRGINYIGLRQGRYRLTVRAGLSRGPWGETSVSFRVLPHYYETAWFRTLGALLLAAGVWGAFRLRVRQLRGRFALVLTERARLAREIHDTLAQGFVGISSQLDAVAMALPTDSGAAQRHLDLAQKMAHHSLTEARRSVMDLRASALENQDLAAALRQTAPQWAAGYTPEVVVEVAGPPVRLRQETEQQLLRIAQEAVTNALKHSGARRIVVRLEAGQGRLRLLVEDDGRGFDEASAFSAAEGRFGLLGMRERAQRIGGELNLHSVPGRGTKVAVAVPE